MHPPVSFVPFTMHLRILCFLFFLSALHRFRLPVAFPTPRIFLSVLRIFPFHPVWFPIQSFRFCLFSSLFVSFRSSLIRSHSRASGARFFSPSSPQVPFRMGPCRLLPFVRLRFRASATQPSVSSFPFIPFSPHSWYSGAHLSTILYGCFHPSVSGLGTQLPCNSLSRY